MYQWTADLIILSRVKHYVIELGIFGVVLNTMENLDDDNSNNNNNNNYYYYYYLLQLGFHPVAVVILHVYKIWNWLLINLSREGYMRSM